MPNLVFPHNTGLIPIGVVNDIPTPYKYARLKRSSEIATMFEGSQQVFAEG